MTDLGTMEKEVSDQNAPASQTSSTSEPLFNRAAERRLVRILDFRILPVLWILHLVGFTDRANIGNAKIQGMEKELHLIGQRFNICIWSFNLGYLVAGVPLAIVFKKYGPRMLCIAMFCWGICVIGCGLVKKWEQLVVCRLLEGMAEATYVPACAYLIGAYYTKNEYLTRYVFFFSASIIAGAFNGFLASLIAKMDGTAGYRAWRWIFIIEGCITIFVSLATLLVIPEFPENCSFLSPEDKALMLARVKGEGGHVVEEDISFKKAVFFLKDWKIWAGVAMNIGVTENANSLANFQPTILRGLGYNATQAQVHTIPVYIVGAAFSILFGYLSDRLQRRYYFYILGWAVLVAGLSVEIVYPANPKVRYMGIFFIACGCYLAMPVTIIWNSINSGTGYKRAVSIAANVNFGTAGAFVSSNVFLYKETPRFHTGFSTGLGLACMGASAATILWLGCRYQNKKRDQQRADLPLVLDESMEKLGDEHPDFRFAL
ncbi:major facilitator superfamily domain-containing protein [Phaeosphaeriaceae sp. PMI808]|nr:major facilitator superfamily domain-containing protein [Phaeosphaeriaceae sp. PMI808]